MVPITTKDDHVFAEDDASVAIAWGRSPAGLATDTLLPSWQVEAEDRATHVGVRHVRLLATHRSCVSVKSRI